MLSMLHQLVPKLAEHFTAWGVVLAGFVAAFATVGWDLPPFAGMDRTTKIEQNLNDVGRKIDSAQRETQQQQTANMCILLDVQRTTWRATLRSAEADLRKNPGSDSAKEAVEEAKRRLRDVNRKIQGLGVSCPI